ncbi:bifunctional folylpolyglutamate synthase/dihydrofolate synthase [Enterococcus saccharolyticus]|uniref:bifunctional folylpolyglutamate synthase/dihydrofolate synthase n=1 Tax=Enterococcus TaxID=1350 RepID=UPI001E649AAE|nr:folylpolyglutamate synthase/dihydrofolate synthase family protein [Enterococcus saccharolyticus]MCD5003290.1 bifunctional folylpolyglutamate synthase/dihydrofolate synthase [Enterococcus saccharolyticus]
MLQTVEEAIEWVHSRLPFGSRPGLERIEALLALLDHPEKNVPMIHVAGTNGKGSTVSYLRAMIQETGLTVGTFTSPYIESFNERIAMNGVAISDEELLGLVKKIRPLVAQLDEDEQLSGITEFEVLTAMAFVYYAEQQVDVAIIEVGLGGLLDSTNVISPMLTAITTIGMDHMDILGDTLEEIAEQKAGIIKEGIPVVTGNIQEKALRVINRIAEQKQAEVHRFDQAYQVTYKHPDAQWGEVFDFYNESGRLPELKTSLLGKHQVENAGVAIQLFYLYCQTVKIPFQEKNVREGLKRTFWPARMERISEEPLVILDGAHNEHAIKRLVENIKQEFSNYRIHILFSALETKEISTMIHQLLELPNANIYLTSFDYPKALRLEKNYQKIDEKRIQIASLWQFGLADILEKAEEDSLVLVTGSLYFVSEVRNLLQEL